MSADSTIEFVPRPFEGLPGEADLVAMREIIPAATATVRTTKEFGSRDVTIVTSLPESWPALHRADGQILLALQTHAGSGDLSRDLAATLLEVLEVEPGTPIITQNLPGPGPRLQDVLDLSVPFDVTVHDNFEFWLDPNAERSAELDRSLKEAADAIIDTVKLESVPHAYWCRMGKREYLRWSFAQEEDSILDAIARLHAKRESGLAGGKFIGAFRTCGISIPVWELERGTEADELEAPAAEFLPKFQAAINDSSELTSDERRARAGIVARQKTLR